MNDERPQSSNSVLKKQRKSLPKI